MASVYATSFGTTKIAKTSSHGSCRSFSSRASHGRCYSQYFNKRHGWVGHVVQNRFHSSRITDDAYLLAAIAYVHRNPVEAGPVRLEALADYPWRAVPMAALASSFPCSAAPRGRGRV